LNYLQEDNKDNLKTDNKDYLKIIDNELIDEEPIIQALRSPRFFMLCAIGYLFVCK
jgi:hypothetical protein